MTSINPKIVLAVTRRFIVYTLHRLLRSVLDEVCFRSSVLKVRRPILAYVPDVSSTEMNRQFNFRRAYHSA